MHRIPEPELMSDDDQAEAYAQADFSEAHQAYVTLFDRLFPTRDPRARVLDLGCGACDVVIRFARANPGYTFDAVDGSPAMLRQARLALERFPDVAPRVRLVEGYIPDVPLPHAPYDALLSSSFLHHLHRPEVLWQVIRRQGRPGALVLVTDLRRPDDEAAARDLVARYAADAPPVLRRDFHNSLLAAFTPGEVRAQLAAAGLHTLAVEVISDRHLAVHGLLD
jgi:SAM-dependent methyltransferase